MFTHAIITRQHEIGLLPQLGTVEQVAHRGYVIISHFDKCLIRPGDKLALSHQNTVILATALELHIDGTTKQELLLTARTEVGIRFDRKIRKGASVHALREQQTAPYQILRTIEQRRDDLIASIADRFRTLTLVTTDGRQATLDGIDGVDFDSPHIPAIADHHADFQLATRITFTANVPQQGNAVNEDGKAGVEVIQGTVGIRVTGRLGFASINGARRPATIRNHREPAERGRNRDFRS